VGRRWRPEGEPRGQIEDCQRDKADIRHVSAKDAADSRNGFSKTYQVK
jgi:hypothetical protein